MSLAAAIDALETLLTTHAGLAAWASTHFARAITPIRGNTPIEAIDTALLPALVLELGEAENQPLVGGQQASHDYDLPIAYVWHEQTAATAFAQRVALPDLVAQALMSDEQLGGACDGAWMSGWRSDVNAGHPFHVMNFTVAVNDRIALA